MICPEEISRHEDTKEFEGVDPLHVFTTEAEDGWVCSLFPEVQDSFVCVVFNTKQLNDHQAVDFKPSSLVAASSTPEEWSNLCGAVSTFGDGVVFMGWTAVLRTAETVQEVPQP